MTTKTSYTHVVHQREASRSIRLREPLILCWCGEPAVHLTWKGPACARCHSRKWMVLS